MGFLGGLMGGLGKIGSAVGAGAKKAVGAGQAVKKAPVLKSAPQARGVGGAGLRSFANPGGTFAKKPTFIGGAGGPSGFATKAPVKGVPTGKGATQTTPKQKVLKAKSGDQAGETTETQQKEKWYEKPVTPLPEFAPDYGFGMQGRTAPEGGGLRTPLKGMKPGSSIMPIGGNPLHYHTHKAGQNVPKSSTSKIGSGKRCTKSTLHHGSK